MCVTLCIKCYLLSLIGDNNEETTNQEGEKSEKKGKRRRKKCVELEETVVGKRRQRLHVEDIILTLYIA